MKIEQDGKEIEVFTAEELAARTEEVKAATVAEYEAKVKTLETASTEAARKAQKAEADLKEAVEKGGGNAAQIQRLREARDKAEAEAAEAKEKLKGTSDIDTKLDEFKRGLVGDFAKDYIKTLSQGDADLEKKILYEFENYRPNEVTKEAIEERVKKAYTLASGSPSPSVFSAGLGAGSRGVPQTSPKPGAATANELKIGSALGITEADRKAYETFKAKQK